MVIIIGRNEYKIIKNDFLNYVKEFINNKYHYLEKLV